MSVNFDPKNLPISGPAIKQAPSAKSNSPKDDGSDFRQLLQQKLDGSAGVSLSKHAGKRAQERNIDVGTEVMGQLSSAVDIAEQRGIKDALILGGEAAFIVNIASRTIITTVGSDEMNQAVFTNIDGTVIL